MDTFEVDAAVIKCSQNALPPAIREVLKDRSVCLTNEERPGDPVIAGFLDFIADDIGNNLGSLWPVTPEWLCGLQQLAQGVAIDLDAPLSQHDE